MSSNFKAAQTVTGEVDGSGMRIAVVCARFNDLITNRMLEGTLGGLAVHGVKESDVTVAWVPGAFEIPVAAKQCAGSGEFDAIITLGAVIRGDTAHFEYVAGPCAEGIQLAALETGVPIIFGVLTTENLDQALQRSDLDGDNKGEEAARTALEMVDLLRRLPSAP
ncbi:MAG: 6,7-dimethyl-8-ribityllumazine synthase [Actinomycetes bacterium]